MVVFAEVDEDAVVGASSEEVSGEAQPDETASTTGSPETEEPEPSTSRSFRLQHCIGSSCFERGSLILVGARSARIADSKAFEEMRDSQKLHAMLNEEKHASAFYKIVMEATSATGKDSAAKKSSIPLVTSIPVRDVRNPEDLHDNLEVTLTPKNEVIAINYRIKAAWGLNLFEHTAVRLSNAQMAAAPVIPPKPKTKPDGSPMEPKDDSPFILQLVKRYWWVFLLGMLFLNFAGPEEEGGGPPQESAKGKKKQ